MSSPVGVLRAGHDVREWVKRQIEVMTTVCRLGYLQCREWQSRPGRPGVGQFLLSRTGRGRNRCQQQGGQWGSCKGIAMCSAAHGACRRFVTSQLIPERESSSPSEKLGCVAMGLETLDGGMAAEDFASVVGMVAVADQKTDGPVDGGQLGQTGHSGNERVWRHIGIKGDSPIVVDLAVPLAMAV